MMEWAMPKKTVLDSRVGDLFWYWVMAVRHRAVPALASHVAVQA
jgi:hypothetical protein